MDQLYIASRLRIERNKIVHIKRRLANAKGKIKVKVGDEVFPQDVVAEGHTISGFRTIHLSRELRVNPQRAEEYLLRHVGQPIYQGELLARRKDFLGLSKHLVMSPVDGVLEVYDNKSGNLKIQLTPKTTKLVSGVYGIVDHINETAGQVSIRTMVNQVYGVLGSGKEREGLLKILGPADLLTSSKQIPPQSQGRILVAGGIIFMDALEMAINLRIAGIICGGINAGNYKSMVGGQWNILRKHWTDVGLSLIVTEGFGSAPIGEDIFSILKEYNESFVILEGNSSKLTLPINDQNSIIYTRKTGIPKDLQQGELPEVSLLPLREGVRVRIISAPYLGVLGTVEAVDESLTKLPSGLQSYMVTVNTKSRKIQVPYVNLEIVKYIDERA